MEDGVAARRISCIMRHLHPLPRAPLDHRDRFYEVVPTSASDRTEAEAELRERVILVVGAGDATGGAIAKKFATEGYTACLVRRQADKLDELAQDIIQSGGKAHAFGIDARKEDQVVALVEQIEKDIGDIEVLVFNIGANVNFSILETTSRVYRKVWEMASFAGFLAGREVAKRMVGRGHGTIFFTGATASVRGGWGYAAFAGAKFSLRALAQSMARELGPKGIHVAHLIVDGPIDTQWTRGLIKDNASLRQKQGMLNPGDIGDIYWFVHQQPKTAWTHEMDVRPWIETW
jgi:NAD(P)-dependent dehydrogenase (short-subunit alcohol dehydrogenase family)